MIFFFSFSFFFFFFFFFFLSLLWSAGSVDIILEAGINEGTFTYSGHQFNHDMIGTCSVMKEGAIDVS